MFRTIGTVISGKHLFKRLNQAPALTGRRTSFLDASNASYIDELYEEWKKDPKSVHKSWDLVFRASEKGVNLDSYLSPQNSNFLNQVKPNQTCQTQIGAQQIIDQLSVNNLIHAYQANGHQVAMIDPFEGEFDVFEKHCDNLDISFWNLTQEHMDRMFILPQTTYIGGEKKEMSLREILHRLKQIYTSSIGIEYNHIESQEQMDWLRRRFESRIYEKLNVDDHQRILRRIVRATLFERYCAKKYPAEKRFGLEGLETMVALLGEVEDFSSIVGVESIFFGMAHRGRLNVLTNVCGQPPEHIFMRFNDHLEMEGSGSSDVKYHLGVSRNMINSKTGKPINISLIANPSHLEAVNPVVKGRVKAEQHLRNDPNGKKVMSVLIHGDAAFAGQGVVFETINMSKLENYNVGGTIHVVANNQIGFTTNPQYSRGSRYCTEVGKISKAPVIHVNADDAEAVCFVGRLAADYRNTFNRDVVVDLVGYRRHGHNEGDNPVFTQPLMYAIVSKRPDILEIYSKNLIESQIMDESTINQEIKSYEKLLDEEFSKAQQAKAVVNKVWIDSPWKNFFTDNPSFSLKSTGYDLNKIIQFQKMSCQFPSDFNINPGVKRVLDQRLDMLEKNKIDWAMGEIAAFSSLLTSGIHIRLSGQDVERGTFSHRHHVLHDSEIKGLKYCAMNHLDPQQEKYSLCNSPLSEYGVLGYEHGYSMANPNILAIWEGQFGDFANNAQSVIDQFICSGEDKWIRQSGIVMLLPHGYDGMGPEHSSARLERYLQLTREDPDTFPSFSKDTFEGEQLFNCNYIVAYPTTPANIFHLLRRQVAYQFRKPLVIMSPKNLLRHPMARSDLSEIAEGTHFKRIIEENGSCNTNSKKVKRHIICSGKVYYELYQMRKDKALDNLVAITRIEQLSPFPFDLVQSEISKYPNADLMYVQEEPKNQGAYYHVKPLIQVSCGYSKILKYSGREVSASPATGSKHRHMVEQTSLLEKAFEF
ncbi:2-oxoglutarate dehydrogenase, mitochondrial [Thelohanellus kitauei]|uniref:2-oxoglutarate dehydrogenase, mitochondrial n=1 Tax=Thelohanellus kitauei TaxID=669202 RepID=A0A0C2MR09_THEKT|nr:2-oxoglutarate dehydrogenase, mitochondrial [Thelohanellus kitauei]